MGVGWVARYIPADETFVVPEGSIEMSVALLADCAEAREPTGGLRQHNVIWLDPTPEFARRARAILLPEAQALTLSLELEEYPFPLQALDHAGQRICRACSRVAPTLAVCEFCGVEEDPMEWRIGPPRVLYARSFALSVHFDRSTSELYTLPLGDLDAKLRRLLDGRVETLQSRLGVQLRFLTEVLE
jgi:hypothetical protein